MKTRNERMEVTSLLASALNKSIQEKDDSLSAYQNATLACINSGGWTPKELDQLPVCDTLFKEQPVKKYRI